MDDTPHDPNLAALWKELPVMRDGKPRRFRRYCECFEWTFNQFYNAHNRHPANHVERIGHVDLWANALWHHQNPGLDAIHASLGSAT